MTPAFSFRPEPFPWSLETEWESETDRSSGDYIRWVQSSLNREWGLRLAVDGILGPATRSAIRSFQQRKGLVVDGIVGPKTEAALVAAGAPPPPAGVSAGAAGSAPAAPAPSQCSAPVGASCLVLEGFAQDHETLTEDHRQLVKPLAERLLKGWETGSLLLIGHASPEGTTDYNHDLAMRRAEEVEFEIADQMEDILPGSARWIDFQKVSCGESPIRGITDPARQRRVDICVPPPPRWFVTGGAPPVQMQKVRGGNDVQYFIDGESTFREMVRVIKTATKPDHYIYLLGWWLDDNFDLQPGNQKSRILVPGATYPNRGLFFHASNRGAQVRAMLWALPLPDQVPALLASWVAELSVDYPNEDTVDHINALSHGAAILDSRVLRWAAGAHHQKILIVKGEEGLIAFCGGIDINPDRISPVGATAGAPFHDVHCEIKGPAAHDLLTIFLERWRDHPESAAHDRAKGTLIGWRDHPGKGDILLPPAGNVSVQIGRTFGNGTTHSGVSGGYSFARIGEQTTRPMILRAIAEAKRFIYIEDQYLVSMEVSAALRAALQRVPNLIVIILIPNADVTALAGQTRYRRQDFIAPLRQVAPNRVGVFFLGTPACTSGNYVHSKMMVVDDEYAIVGSANLCRRSLTHDSEAVAGIYDPSPNPIAKRLRVALWAKHLRMSPSALGDAVASARHWFAATTGPRQGTGICVYQENLGTRRPTSPEEQRLRDEAWLRTADPDGS